MGGPAATGQEPRTGSSRQEQPSRGVQVPPADVHVGTAYPRPLMRSLVLLLRSERASTAGQWLTSGSSRQVRGCSCGVEAPAHLHTAQLHALVQVTPMSHSLLVVLGACSTAIQTDGQGFKLAAVQAPSGTRHAYRCLGRRIWGYSGWPLPAPCSRARSWWQAPCLCFYLLSLSHSIQGQAQPIACSGSARMHRLVE